MLDVGFNLISNLPEDGFSSIRALTLLALDGNPLPTLPRRAFRHLNGTLRGLSLGGRFLKCDCKLRWIAEWIRDTDLQVTSRERNPQFCGTPNDFRLRSFYQLGPEGELCAHITSSGTLNSLMNANRFQVLARRGENGRQGHGRIPAVHSVHHRHADE